MVNKEDEPYINQELLDAFSPQSERKKTHEVKEHSVQPLSPKNHHQRNVNPEKRQKWAKIYWSIPSLIFVFILAIGIEDDPADSGMHEILLTIVGAGLIALILLVMFGIPFLIYKRIHKRRSNNSNDKDSKLNLTTNIKRRNETSNKKKWIYTLILVVLAPFTILISLLLIPLVWSSRFSLSRGGTSKLTTKKVREPHYIRYAVIICVVIVGFILYKPVTDRVTLQIESSNASEPIKDIADHSGFSPTSKLIFYKSDPELVNADTIISKCPTDDQTTIEYGCYLPSENKMYILEVADSSYKDVEYTTAAHETLHAVYVNLDSFERERVINLIKQFYNDTANAEAVKLHETVKPYGSDEFVIDNELHSFIGSETADTSLSQPLSNYYKKYFSDRSVSVNANVTFNSKIESKIASLDSEYNRLGDTIARIDTYKVQHLDNIQAAMNRANYYGDTYSYNKNVDAYNNNLEYYNSQVDLYNSQRLTYNANVGTFNAILRAFYPTKAQLNTK